MTGYTYHIKDVFFSKVNDPTLMANKEGGNFRPHYFCVEDSCYCGVYWAVPLSSRVEKYKRVYIQKMERFGRCDTIEIGKCGGKDAAFLIQNMFPITTEYIEHPHTINGIPVKLHKGTQDILEQKVKRVLSIWQKHPSILFADIQKIYCVLGLEIYKENPQKSPEIRQELPMRNTSATAPIEKGKWDLRFELGKCKEESSQQAAELTENIQHKKELGLSHDEPER